jgi:uncharacterized membrane protein YcaP (DUF421 family)
LTLFGSWEDIVRVLIFGGLAYLALVIFLRLSGKRTLSKMNAFDLVVTVALGSMLATIILSSDVSLAEGVIALSLLIALQLVVAWLSSRMKSIERIVKSEPRILLYNGDFLTRAMLEERVTESEVRQAVRSSGVQSLNDVRAVVLETDGTFSVIGKSGDPDESSLEGVDGTAIDRRS